MNPRYQRIARKLLRPLRRRLFAAPPQVDLTAFSGPTLVLIAHPDDEVFCSGLICQLLQKKLPVHLVCFTRGEGGERGNLSEDVSLGHHRAEELAQAARILAVTSLTLLDYVDPAMKDGHLSEPEHDGAELLNELQSFVEKHEIINLVTHGSSGEYWHPAHLLLHRLARVLNRRLPRLQLWTFNAWHPEHPLPAVINQDDPAHLSLEASGFSDTRLQALAAHQSQRAVFERFGNGTLADFIKLTNREHFRKW